MRYLPLTPDEENKILKTCGEASFETLTRDIPESLRLIGKLNIPDALAETELLSHIQELGEKNKAAKMTCLIGQGAYDHTWPAVVDYLVTRGEFLTAYTPYQPEVSQGTLQAIFEFQSMIANLLGMEVANASLYDGSTSLVEAILMGARLQNKTSGEVLISEGVYDHTKEILETYLRPLGFKLVTWSATNEGIVGSPPTLSNPVGVVVQSPNKWGMVEDWKSGVDIAKKLGVKSIAYVPHAHSTTLFESPGSKGIDIACGEGQTLGIPLGFGGPYLGLFACKKADVRQMPGRLIGKTVDSRGREAFCVTLSTREQHIRREKATSNICSNQSLMALRATIYLGLMGPKGMREVAKNSRNAAYFVKSMVAKHFAKDPKSVRIIEGTFFNEFSILYSQDAERKIEKLISTALAQNILLGIKTSAPSISGFKGALTLAFTERFKKVNAEKLDKIFEEIFI